MTCNCQSSRCPGPSKCRCKECKESRKYDRLLAASCQAAAVTNFSIKKKTFKKLWEANTPEISGELLKDIQKNIVELGLYKEMKLKGQLHGILAKVPCPFLGTEVELTKERMAHIFDSRDSKDELFYSIDLNLICAAIHKPDAVVRGLSSVLRFYKYTNNGGYKLMVAVKSDPKDARKWIVTAFVTSKEIEGDILWTAR